MQRIRYGFLLIALIPSAYAALPGDIISGQRLYDANCMSCHDASIHTRSDRKVRSLEALKQQVAGCSHMAKKDFSVAEKQSIVKYLNERFYHFN